MSTISNSNVNNIVVIPSPFEVPPTTNIEETRNEERINIEEARGAAKQLLAPKASVRYLEHYGKIREEAAAKQLSTSTSYEASASYLAHNAESRGNNGTTERNGATESLPNPAPVLPTQKDDLRSCTEEAYKLLREAISILKDMKDTDQQIARQRDLDALQKSILTLLDKVDAHLKPTFMSAYGKYIGWIAAAITTLSNFIGTALKLKNVNTDTALIVTSVLNALSVLIILSMTIYTEKKENEIAGFRNIKENILSTAWVEGLDTRMEFIEVLSELSKLKGEIREYRNEVAQS